MMGGGAAKVEELMLHLQCREFQAFSLVGLNVNDVTSSCPSERQLPGHSSFTECVVWPTLK